MSFYLQHSYGKSDKVDRLVRLPEVAGVVLSPKDEDPEKLGETADAVRSAGKSVLVDPQAYFYSTDPPGKAPKHRLYGLPVEQIHRAASVRRISERIDAVAHMNDTLGHVDYIIAPAPLQTGLGDPHAGLSLQYASTAAESWGTDRTIATLAVDQRAFDDSSGISRWLDELTALRVAGFYLLVDRGDGVYPPYAWSATTLRGLFQFLYVLGELNEYKVLWGYGDTVGAVGAAVANGSTASGWSYGARTFNSSRWMYPSTWASPPVIRTIVPGLGAAVRAEDEALGLLETEHASELWPGENLETVAADMRALQRPEAQVAFLARLASLADRLGGPTDTAQRIEGIQSYLDTVEANFMRIGADGLLGGTRYAQAAANVRRAFISFREAEGL